MGCAALSAPSQCPDSCAEGCQCDPGFLNNGQTCVPIQECGCYHNGAYYEVGTQPSSSWTPLPQPIGPTALSTGLPHVSPTHPEAPPWSHLSSPTWLPWVPRPPGSGKDLSKYDHGSCNLKPSLAPRSSFGFVTQIQTLLHYTSGSLPVLLSPTLSLTPLPLI